MMKKTPSTALPYQLCHLTHLIFQTPPRTGCGMDHVRVPASATFFLCARPMHCQNDQNDCSHFRRMPSGLITKPDLWHCDLPWLGLPQHIYTSENTMSMATTKCFMCRILIQGLALAMTSSLHNSIGEKSRNGEKSLLKMVCGRKIQQ